MKKTILILLMLCVPFVMAQNYGVVGSGGGAPAGGGVTEEVITTTDCAAVCAERLQEHFRDCKEEFNQLIVGYLFGLMSIAVLIVIGILIGIEFEKYRQKRGKQK